MNNAAAPATASGRYRVTYTDEHVESWVPLPAWMIKIEIHVVGGAS